MVPSNPLRAAAGMVFALLCATAAAQSYPSKPVTLIVPYGTGGTADISARGFAAIAQKYLGQPIVVQNRPGASGIIGSKHVHDSSNDGYTLLAARISSQVALPALEPRMVPYPWDAFTIVGLLEFNPFTCIVSARSPYKTLQDLLSAIKARPGKLNVAVAGAADASVVMPVLALRSYGLPADAATQIQYKGGGDMLIAVLGGHVDFSCNSIPSFMSALSSGDARALVVTSESRLPELPLAPTPAEVAMPSLRTVNAWGALYGPPSLPQNVLDKWSEVLAKVAADPEWLRQLRGRAAVQGIGTMSLAEERRFIAAQYEEYRALAPLLTTNK
ncbi:MAG: Bug family tripartite tricarboxylate transporter substrate binding protein [Burkholderiaceae bacterium]